MTRIIYRSWYNRFLLQLMLIAAALGMQTVFAANYAVSDLPSAILERVQHPLQTQPLPILNSTDQIIFIDAAVKDYQQLLHGLAPNTVVYQLNSQHDGVRQMATILRHYNNLQAVHIIAHGGVASVQLGTAQLNAATLATHYQNSMHVLRQALADDADVLLHSCYTGKGLAGQYFVAELAAASGADVAASSNKTGSVLFGGDWQLDVRNGVINSPSPFSHYAVSNWPHVLSHISPMFDGNGGEVDGDQTYTEADNGDGITLTVVFADDVPGGATSTAAIDDGEGIGGSTGNYFFAADVDETQTVTVSFSGNVSIRSFQYIEADTKSAGTYTFTPSGGGTAVVISAGSFNDDGITVTLTDWNAISGFVITNSRGVFSPGLDTIVYSLGNNTPTITGVSSSVTVIEDVATNINLSALTVADANGDTLTATLSANVGTLAAATGNGISGGVTVSGSTTATLSLVGTAANINTFLDTATNIQYTTARNDNTARNIAVKVNDGTVDSATRNIIVNITAVDDAATNITLSANSINQSATAAAANVGNLSSTDVDDVSFTYALVSNGTSDSGACGVGNAANNASFQIATAALQTRAALTPGSYVICVQTTGSGTTFQKTFSISVVENALPASPSTPDLVAGSDTGSSATDNYTRDTTPTFSGTAEANSTVTVFSSVKGSLGATIANASGNWSFTSGVLSAGAHIITATATDAELNTSAASSGLLINIDITAPVITAVSIPNSSHAVGDTVIATITVSSDVDNYSVGGLLSGNINGYALGALTKISNTRYSASFTMTNGGTDIAAASNVPLSVVLTDRSGNANSAFTTAISQAGDAMYANVPAVSLTASSKVLAENSGTVTLSASLSGSLNNRWPVSVTVNLAYTGNAIRNTDYTAASSISIAAGNVTGTTVVAALTDAIVDAGETIMVDISSLSVGREGSPNRQTLTITPDSPVVNDFDKDGLPDSIDPDDDNDGMPDIWEIDHGLNPFNASDASADTDGDGVNNLNEYRANTNPTLDDYAPLVTPLDDIILVASGWFTRVDIGLASAIDTRDGVVSASSDAPTQFRPGVNTVTWRATDAAGNIGSAVQIINIIPLVNFSKNQLLAEGGSGSFRIILNGNAVTYPVTVPYTISGTASTDGSDHDLVSGSAVINSGREVTVYFNSVQDAVSEGVETIDVTMAAATNAVLGSHTVHRIDLTENNVVPRAQLSAEQNVLLTRFVTQTGGAVSVSAEVLDSNTGDSHSYNWSASDNALIDTDNDVSRFGFDPSVLTPGFYTLRLSVSDGPATSKTELMLHVLSAAPLLSTTDSDLDGITDLVEGFADSDGDGIADYLDAIRDSNVLQTQLTRIDGFVLEAEPGLRLSLGRIAFRANHAAAVASMSDVNQAGYSTDSGYVYTAGLFDFIVTDLTATGQSVTVVLPQTQQLKASAMYHILQGSLWQNFVVNTNNAITSAAGEQGYCPPPGDAAYTSGLTAGHWCVQLTIGDGGFNDADNNVNGKVSHTGGVTQKIAIDNNNGLLGLGRVELWWLLVWGVFGLLAVIDKRKPMPQNKSG